MADLSVNQISAKAVNLTQNGVSGQYSKLKAKYEQFKAKYKSSDFANAPTLLEQEIKLLKDLKSAALIENVSDEEIKPIDERIDEISKELKQQDDINANNQNLHIGFVNSKYSADIVRRNVQEEIRNLRFDTISFEKLLEQVENPKQIMNFATRLSENDVSLEDIIRITDMLLVPAVDAKGVKTEKFILPEQSVKSVIAAQGAIHLFADNEQKEVKSPVYNLDVEYEYSDKGFFIKRKNQVIYSQQFDPYDILKKPTAQEKHQQYENSVKAKERRILFDFIKKYKDENGIIPYQYAMAVLHLKKSGIVNDELLNLLDSCIIGGGKVNRNKLYKIAELKKAGAVSEDILKILDKCRINQDGKYNSNDVDTAIGLTQAVLGEKQICELLPILKDLASSKANVYNAYDFVISASQYFKNKDNLVQLVKMCMTDDNVLNEDAVDMIDTMFFNETNDLTEEEFMEYAAKLLQVAKGGNENGYDSADSICYGLNELNVSLKETISILQLCQDSNGNYNQDLSDMIWTIGVNDNYKSECSAGDIVKLLNICKTENTVDTDKIAEVMTLVKKNTPIKEILTSFGD